MFEQDWIMRQVSDMVRFMTRVILQKESPLYQQSGEESPNSESGLPHQRLGKLIDEQKFREAKNVLDERMDGSDRKDFEVAVDFYARLNRMDDKTLEENGFSREEIQEGLNSAAHAFGVTIFPD